MVFNRETHVSHERRSACRHDWTQEEVLALFGLPFNDLIFQAQTVHRAHFSANEVQISTLLSIKTGGCPEDCAYCPQSAHFHTGLQSQKLMSKDVVLAEAKKAKAAGASRFCMGAAWRAPRDSEVDEVAELVAGVKSLGLETCATLGMLTKSQAERLKDAGLDYYNHNLDTSESYYDQIITTRTYQDRLDTLACVRDAGMHVCCGGILGMGETVEDRAAMLRTLANLPVHPESVPINMLVRVSGTPLADARPLDPLDFARTIATARIVMPASFVRLSAGREAMSEELQALCFLAGANSIFFGERLLTTPNPAMNSDRKLLERLGLRPFAPQNPTSRAHHRDRKLIMSERPKPEREVIHPEVEILRPGDFEPTSPGGNSRVWLTVNSRGGTRRLYMTKPGPFATIFLVLAFGAFLTVAFLVALGLFAILVGVSAVVVSGLLIYGLVRGALMRLRTGIDPGERANL